MHIKFNPECLAHTHIQYLRLLLDFLIPTMHLSGKRRVCVLQPAGDRVYGVCVFTAGLLYGLALEQLLDLLLQVFPAPIKQQQVLFEIGCHFLLASLDQKVRWVIQDGVFFSPFWKVVKEILLITRLFNSH